MIRFTFTLLVLAAACALPQWLIAQEKDGEQTISASQGAASRIVLPEDFVEMFGATTFCLKLPYRRGVDQDTFWIEDLPAGFSMGVLLASYEEGHFSIDETEAINSIQSSLLIASKDKREELVAEIVGEVSNGAVHFRPCEADQSGTTNLNVTEFYLTNENYTHGIRVDSFQLDSGDSKSELFLLAIPLVPGGLPDPSIFVDFTEIVDHGKFDSNNFIRNRLIQLKTPENASTLNLGAIDTEAGKKNRYEIADFPKLNHKITFESKSIALNETGLKSVHISLRVKGGPLVINKTFDFSKENSNLKESGDSVYFGTKNSNDWACITNTSAGTIFRPDSESTYELEVTIIEIEKQEGETPSLHVVIKS